MLVGGVPYVPQAEGFISKQANRPVEDLVRHATELLNTKGITLFALIDHSGEAENAGLQMPPTKLLIFGNPKAGTPVMVAAPTSAIDLPLKILIWEDAERNVWVSYNDPAYLQQRHGIPAELVKNISAVEGLIALLAG